MKVTKPLNPQSPRAAESAPKPGPVAKASAPPTSGDAFEAGAARTAALLGTNLARTGFGSGDFEAALDRETHSVARAGNDVRMLFDGVNSFAERDRLIDGATDSIHLQTFIFTADDTGWALARRLAAKAEQGVKVRVIYDALGSKRSGDEIFDFMREHGVEVRPYGDPMGQFWDLNDRWHEKHLIVDGKVSIEGGMNIADEYALGGSGKRVFARGGTGTEAWRDADARLEGPAVGDAQRAFLRNWEFVGGEVSEAERASLLPDAAAAAPGCSVRVVQHRPDEEGDQNVQALYLRAIRTAQRSITIENAYFIPPAELRQALIDAARRGVAVQVMTNSRASNDMGFVSDAARYFYDDLIAAGVRVHEKQGGTLHAKTATFDGQYSIVGSANLNGRSKGHDSEVVLAIGDGATARALEERFAAGVSQATEVTAQELRKEGFFQNLQQWTLSLFAGSF